MGKGNVDAVAFEMHNRVKSWCCHRIVEQVLKTISADDTAAVVKDGESCVQVRIVAQHVVDKFALELEVKEQILVWFEIDVSTVFFFGRLLGFRNEFSAIKDGFAHQAVAITARHELSAQRIDGFQTHTVHTDRSGKDCGVVLTTCIQFRNGIYQFSQRNTTAVVANFCVSIVCDIYFNLLTKSFVEFVDTVVDSFLQQYIDTIFGVRAIAQASDIHPRTSTDVLHPFEGADIILCIGGSTTYILQFYIYFGAFKYW